MKTSLRAGRYTDISGTYRYRYGTGLFFFKYRDIAKAKIVTYKKKD